MANLSSITTKFNFIINYPNDVNVDIINLLKVFCENNTSEYYFILHDKDIDANAELKTKHIHLLFIVNKRARLLTMIKRLSQNIFNSDDLKYLNLFTVDIWREHDLGIQYLVHKNDSDKYQYDVKSVYTNDKEYLKTVLEFQIERALDIDKLIQLCYENDSILDVFRLIGLNNSRNYLNLIREIYARIHPLPF